ncbi:MAG: hypothetical protein Q4E53_12240 [Eubacteriales bacterium]|nr:hypothetical protein [Eubacteriales bacterium]
MKMIFLLINELATDTHISDLSYNIIVGVPENVELYEDYTELRYIQVQAAKDAYSYPEQGKLPE